MARAKKRNEDHFVVAKNVKTYLHAKGYKISGKFLAALSERTRKLLDEAAARCEGNSRRTLHPSDV